MPGTFTRAFDFYRGDVQQVGRWMKNEDPNVVTLVWKVGEFPGVSAATVSAEEGTDAPAVARIG